MDGDAHVVDHADDVLDLLGIDDVIGQVIVHLGIGQVALLLAAGDQLSDLGLLILNRHGSRCNDLRWTRGRARSREPRIIAVVFVLTRQTTPADDSIKPHCLVSRVNSVTSSVLARPCSMRSCKYCRRCCFLNACSLAMHAANSFS